MKKLDSVLTIVFLVSVLSLFISIGVRSELFGIVSGLSVLAVMFVNFVMNRKVTTKK